MDRTYLLGLFCFFSFGFFSSAEPESPPQLVREVAEGFHEAMVVCPDRIWPNYSWSDYKILFVQNEQQSSWLWDASSNQFKAYDNSQLAESTLNAGFKFFEIEGKPTTSLALNGESRDSLFELGAHEFFHFKGQEGWDLRQKEGRGTLYPVEATPRLYRRALFDSLLSYFASNSETDLGQASYWYNKWKTEFPGEVVRSTDDYEGTAEYVGDMALILSQLGCESSETELRRSVLAHVSGGAFGLFVSGRRFQLDNEGYDIGALASFVLRFQENLKMSWTEEIKSGVSPVEILLRDVTQVPAEISPEITELFENTENRVNSQIGVLADQAIQWLPDSSFIRIPFHYEFLQGNFYPSFFGVDRKSGLDFMAMARDHRFISENLAGSNFLVKTGAVVFSTYSAACPNQFAYIVVNQNAFDKAEGTFLLESEVVSGKLVGKIVESSDDGFRYFCIE